MEKIDLSGVQDKVNLSREAFLSAMEQYDRVGNADGKTIIQDYLAVFLDRNPKRSPIAVDTARQTIAEIETFNGKMANLSEKVAIAALGLQGSLGELMTLVLRHGKDEMLRRLNEAQKKIQRTARVDAGTEEVGPSIPPLDTTLNEITRKVVVLGEQVSKVQSVATAVIHVRQATLRQFKDKNVDISLLELARRVRDAIGDETGHGSASPHRR